VLLWAWLQENRAVGAYDYAGCMTVPRLLTLAPPPPPPPLPYGGAPGADGGPAAGAASGGGGGGWRLYQEPLPELAQLRAGGGPAWAASGVHLAPNSPVALPPSVRGPHLDLELTFAPSSAPVTGLLMRPWSAGGEGGAALLFNWNTHALEARARARAPGSSRSSTRLATPAARARSRGAEPAASARGISFSCRHSPPLSPLSSSLLLSPPLSSSLLLCRSPTTPCPPPSHTHLTRNRTVPIQVVYEALEPASMMYSLSAPGARQVGGRLEGLPPGQPLTLRVRAPPPSLPARLRTLHAALLSLSRAPSLSVRCCGGEPPPKT